MFLITEDAHIAASAINGFTKKIGHGAFGEVFKGMNPITKKQLAIKRVRFENVDNDIPINAAREIMALRLLNHHNVLKFIGTDAYGMGIVLVTEYMDTDLGTLIRHACSSRNPFSEYEQRYIMQSIMRGVYHCHSNQIMHRDIKPSNVLLSATGEVKLADFGLARVFDPLNKRCYSHQVASRWYRAPELLFGARCYSEKIDLWSVGIIMIELVLLYPLFRGNSDIDQIDQVLKILGTPSEKNWPGVSELPDYGKLEFKPRNPIALECVVMPTSTYSLELLKQLVQLNPDNRKCAAHCLAHPFFYQQRISEANDIAERVQCATTNKL